MNPGTASALISDARSGESAGLRMGGRMVGGVGSVTARTKEGAGVRGLGVVAARG